MHRFVDISNMQETICIHMYLAQDNTNMFPLFQQSFRKKVQDLLKQGCQEKFVEKLESKLCQTLGF